MGIFKTAWNFAGKHVGKALDLANEFDKANGRRFSKGLAKAAGKGIGMVAKNVPLGGTIASGVGDFIAKNSTNKHLKKFGKGLRGDSLLSNKSKPLSNHVSKPATNNIRSNNYVPL